MSERIYKGACPGCVKFEVVTVDGRGDADTPEGWVELDGWRCPGCPKTAAAGEEDQGALEARLLKVTYGDQSTYGAARERWKRLHLCTTCIHAQVCKYAPDKQGCDALVTISRCTLYVPPMDSI